MTHDLKIAPEWFDTVLSGVKSFEVRKDDRPYKPNDVLILREFDDTKYTGRVCKVDVRFVLRGEYCLDGYCIMAQTVGFQSATFVTPEAAVKGWNRRNCEEEEE